jgi:heptosyltransferase-2
MQRILIVAPNWIGDSLLAQPLLARLQQRYPAASIDALAPAWTSAVLQRMPQLRQVISTPFVHGPLQLRQRWQLARQLRQNDYQLAVVLPNSLKAALLPWFAGIPQRAGFVGESRYGLINRLHRLDKQALPLMAERYAQLAEDPGNPPQRPLGAGQLRVDLANRASQLQRLGLQLDKPVSVFCPGAEYGPAKRWPARHFAGLAALLDQPVLLLGSGKEQALCEEIVALAPGAQLINLAGKTSLDQAIGLIAAARAVVSNDSGLMHVAAGLGVAQVAVFGSSSPEHTPPLSERAQVLWLKRDPSYQPPLDCAPCFERECPLGHTRCLVDILPQRVSQALSLP